MKLVLDTCVLYPTVLREILLGLAGAGFFTPLWSERILEEWARAARKIGPSGESQARGEIALVRAAWPGASVPPRAGLDARLWLPDPADIHVLAAAIAGSADGIVTFNARDFPRATLADEGLARHAPDDLVLGFWQARAAAVETVVNRVWHEANRLSGTPMARRSLLKRARLPRLGKALETSAGQGAG